MTILRWMLLVSCIGNSNNLNGIPFPFLLWAYASILEIDFLTKCYLELTNLNNSKILHESLRKEIK